MNRFPVFISILVLWGCTSTKNPAPLNYETDVNLSGIVSTELHFLPFLDGFGQISDLYMSRSGILYITDSDRHYLHRIDLLAGTRDSLGGAGRGQTSFIRPIAVDATNDLKIYVSDSGNQRITVFDRRFQHLGTISSASLRFSSGSIGRNQNITSGTGIQSEFEPGTLGVNIHGELFFWDDHSGTLRKVLSSLDYIDRSFMLRLTDIPLPPRAISVRDNSVWLLDATGYRIHRFTREGRPEGFIGGVGMVLDMVMFDGLTYLLTDRYILSLESNGRIREVFEHTLSSAQKISVFMSRASVPEFFISTGNTLYRTKLN